MGEGSFSFLPKLDKQYIVKFKDDNGIPIQNFPAITQKRWSIRPLNAIVSDTIRLVVNNPNPADDCIIAIHNSRSLLYGAHVKGRRPEMQVKVPVNDWKPGLTYVCLYSIDGTLRESRLVWVKKNTPVKALLEINVAAYKPQSEINVKLKLTNYRGEPVKGLFSFSCALGQTMTDEVKNIEVYSQFDRFLPDRLLLTSQAFLKNEQSIKRSLLKQERVLSSQSFSALQSNPEPYDGYVNYYNNSIKKPVEMMILGSRAETFVTDAMGKFTLPHMSVRAGAGQKVMLSVVDKKPDGYSIHLASIWEKANIQLAGQNLLRNYIMPDELSYEQKQLLASHENALLEEVIVTGKKKEAGTYFGKSNSSGVCSDYVCQFDVLNCPVHSGVKTPLEGHVYNFETITGIVQVVYHCEYKTIASYIREIPVTLTNTQYAPYNPSEPNRPDAMNSTTLHWQAFVETDERGEADIKFYTNDRTGIFKGVVQGITDGGVFNAEVQFEVKR